MEKRPRKKPSASCGVETHCPKSKKIHCIPNSQIELLFSGASWVRLVEFILMLESYELKVFMFEVGARFRGSHASAPPYCYKVTVALQVDSERFEESLTLTRQKHQLSIYYLSFIPRKYTLLMSNIKNLDNLSNVQVFEMSNVSKSHVIIFNLKKIRYSHFWRKIWAFEKDELSRKPIYDSYRFIFKRF